MREERFADSGMRRRHTTQGEEEHEVDVGGEVAGGNSHLDKKVQATIYKDWSGHESESESEDESESKQCEQ